MRALADWWFMKRLAWLYFLHRQAHHRTNRSRRRSHALWEKIIALECQRIMQSQKGK